MFEGIWSGRKSNCLAHKNLESLPQTNLDPHLMDQLVNNTNNNKQSPINKHTTIIDNKAKKKS